MTDAAIVEFWDQQARSYGADGRATAPDPHYRDLEIRSIVPYLDNANRILDIGCGNGFSTVAYADAYPKTKFTGIDISEEMIGRAPKRRNVKFSVGSILNILDKYDKIVCTRVLINLTSWLEQQDAILSLHRALHPSGELILVENTLEGLATLNELRQKLGVPPIEMRWHNLYLSLHELRAFLRQHFEILGQHNIGNFYYLASRVINAKLALMEGREPKYDDPINVIAAQMPSLGSYGYSPNYLWHLRRR